MKSFLQFIKESSTISQKGWANDKGKTILWSGMTPYHVQYIVNNLSKFGLKEKDVLTILEARYDRMDAPEPMESAIKELEQLRKGNADVDTAMEYLAMKKGWCRVVIGDYSEISGTDLKVIHKVAKHLDGYRGWPSRIKSLEIQEYSENNGPLKSGYEVAKKAKGIIDTSYDIQRWIDGRNADPSKIGKGRSEIGNTMAQFRT